MKNWMDIIDCCTPIQPRQQARPGTNSRPFPPSPPVRASLRTDYNPAPKAQIQSSANVYSARSPMPDSNVEFTNRQQEVEIDERGALAASQSRLYQSSITSAQQEIQDLQASATAGVGISWLHDVETGCFRVAGFTQNSSAQESGMVHVGDILVDVDGHPAVRKTLREVAFRILGQDGTFVTLRLLPPNNRVVKTVQLMRRDILRPGP